MSTEQQQQQQPHQQPQPQQPQQKQHQQEQATEHGAGMPIEVLNAVVKDLFTDLMTARRKVLNARRMAAHRAKTPKIASPVQTLPGTPEGEPLKRQAPQTTSLAITQLKPLVLADWDFKHKVATARINGVTLQSSDVFAERPTEGERSPVLANFVDGDSKVHKCRVRAVWFGLVSIAASGSSSSCVFREVGAAATKKRTKATRM